MNIPFMGVLNPLTLTDVIDISLVALAMYSIYTMLKNTRAVALVKGLVVLAFIRVVGGWFSLNVVNWLLDKSMTMIMVALPVLFQPELRRALEQIGRGRLWHKASALDEEEMEQMIRAVSSAATVMSQHKVGALIVFERDVGLDDRIETGVKLDALVSEDLLLQIFVKDTPLHDGAVVIRGKRIMAASCLLPLTDAGNLSQELGTRHRAAIGQSEQSDAQVLVVSEETGTISMARNGVLNRYLQAEDVEAMLRSAEQKRQVTWQERMKEQEQKILTDVKERMDQFRQGGRK